LSEFDKLRALLDNVGAAKSDPVASWAPAAGTPRSSRSWRWARTLWIVFIVVTVLDAVYLLVKTLPPR